MDTMTPAQILAWLTEHGGQDGPARQDVPGRAVWVAQDGSTLIVSLAQPAGQNTDKQPERWRVEEERLAGSTQAAPASTSQPATRGGATVADARNPNEPVGAGEWLEKEKDFKDLGIAIPSGFTIGTSTGQYYAYRQVYADGHVAIQWLKRGGVGGDGRTNPDPVETTTTGPVATATKEKWDKGTEKEDDASKPPGGLTTKTVNGQVFQWNPATRAYDIPTGAAVAAQQSPEQARASAATAAKTEQDVAEAQRIKNESEWNANPKNAKDGGSGRYETHADRDARLAKEKTETDTRAQSAATAAAASRRADSAEARAVAEANKVGSKITESTINGQHYTTIVTTSPDGKTSKIENFGPDGNAIAALPIAGRRPLPAGMPELDTTNAATARSSYLAQMKWGQQKFNAGEISQEELLATLNASKDAAESVIKGEQQGIENTRATRTQDITQEGNRLTASTAQFANSRQGVDEAIKWGPKGGTQAGTTYLTNLLMQGLANQSTRGNVGPASPTAAPLPSPASIGETGPVPGVPTTGYVTPEMMAPPASAGSAMVNNLAQAASAVGPERAAEIRANPVFRPMAPVGAPGLVGAGVTPTVPATPSPAAAVPSSAPAAPGPIITPAVVNATTGTTHSLIDNLVNPPAASSDWLPGASPVPSDAPVSMAPGFDLENAPPMLKHLYGRSILNQILSGAA